MTINLACSFNLLNSSPKEVQDLNLEQLLILRNRLICDNNLVLDDNSILSKATAYEFCKMCNQLNIAVRSEFLSYQTSQESSNSLPSGLQGGQVMDGQVVVTEGQRLTVG